ncbi:putative protein binding protein [Cucumis melo var. makuwa]|uniref:Uncharacterized protein n=1 Tax=Cucumis melo var. makuwa TaxID=1194695 RepID=A0A5A7T0Z7_CUCMM|nr:putative protein binding protein [Cucumis melo var. makuwa]
MGSKWRKMKLALGLNLCVFVPRTLEDSPSLPDCDSTERFSDAALLSPAHWGSSRPSTPTPSSHGLTFSKSGSKSSKMSSYENFSGVPQPQLSSFCGFALLYRLIGTD